MTFAPYQIDYNVKNTAKTLGFSKKKVIFKFGIANPESIRPGSGLTGAHCRGSEHEVTFLWSLKTGKRQLLVDNKDVHFSESGQNGWTADRAWQHVFHIRDVSTGGNFRCHFISQPVNKEVPGSIPFDLRVSGVSYFSFNQIFQLGTGAMTTREQSREQSGGGGHGHHHSGRDSPMSPEERRAVAAAKAESLRDMGEYRNRGRANTQTTQTTQPASNTTMQRDEASLISFDEPTPAPQIATQGSQGQYQQYASSLTLDTAIDGPGGQQTPSSSGSVGGWNQPMPAAYGQPPMQQAQAQQQQQPGNSMALTAYQQPGGQPAPYVDSMGRMAVGQQQQPGQAQTYGGYPGQNQQQAQQAMMSPSGQSYASQASYGSAPSFAQPPRQAPTPPAPQQQQQQQQQGYGYAQQQQQPPMYNNNGYPPQQQQQQQPPSGYGAPLPQQGSFGSQQSQSPMYNSGASYPPAPAQGYPSQAYNPNQPAY
jgi:hypothetical protein